MSNSSTLHTGNTTIFGPSENIENMPGFWVLANMGKKVLRPGGKSLTSWMLANVSVSSYDKVVEFAPGVGLTSKHILRKQPSVYIGVEKDKNSVNQLRRTLGINNESGKDKVITRKIEDTGLADNSATIVFGEAVLTMHKDVKKRAILREAHRILQPGGRYAIHELCFKPEKITDNKINEIMDSLTQVVRVHSQPLRMSEWKNLFKEEGFEILQIKTKPMSILKPLRLIFDEGAIGTLKFVFNVCKNKPARQRIMAMAKLFNKHHKSIAAFSVIAKKI